MELTLDNHSSASSAKEFAPQCMGAAADLKPMPEFPLILCEGGDDRILLNKETGTNKYHQKPFVPQDVHFRGSCTCNPPTQVGYDAAEQQYLWLKTGKTNTEKLMNDVRTRLTKVYELPKGTGVFLSPSGSDAEYIPLLISKLLNPGKPVTNVVTCNVEIGSGSLAAAGGKFFSPVEPIPSYHSHIDGGPKVNDPVNELADNVETVAINARKPTGEVINADSEIEAALKTCQEKSSVPIIHSVWASKTGICQKLQSQYKEQVEGMGGLFVIDACQGRFETQWLFSQLEHNAIVLVTGSKFYRGPPFSGATLVPEPIMSKLVEAQNAAKIPAGLNTFMGKYEIPPELSKWREQIQENQNPGLGLRWTAALAELELTLQIPSELKIEATKFWRQNVIDLIETQDNLEYFDAAEDTTSIVSISIKKPAGGYFTNDELAKVFKSLTLDMSKTFPDEETASEICFTGQPVLISPEKAVMRIALGSDSLRQVMDDKNFNTEIVKVSDFVIIQKMAFLASNFDKL